MINLQILTYSIYKKNEHIIISDSRGYGVLDSMLADAADEVRFGEEFVHVGSVGVSEERGGEN